MYICKILRVKRRCQTKIYGSYCKIIRIKITLIYQEKKMKRAISNIVILVLAKIIIYIENLSTKVFLFRKVKKDKINK